MKFEFRAGDVVTFNAYNEPIKARVLSAQMVTRQISGDIEVDYRLEGVSKPLVSHSTGRSIEESMYFKPYNPDTFWKE